MSGPARAAIGTAIMLAVWVSPARGQTPAQDPLDRLIGLPVVGVEVRIEGTPDASPALLALVDIRPGDRLTPEAWRRVSERFNHVPRFESVRVLVEEPPGGVLLIFDLTPRHPIDRLEFTFKGAAVLPIEELERQVRDRFNGLPAPTERIDVEEEVEKILANEGYLSAVVTTALERFHDPDRSTLGVTVEAGPRTLIGTIDLRGQSTIDPRRTLARRGVVVGAPFREREVEAALADVRDELRRRQYYTAIAQHQPTVSSDGATVALAVTVEAGPLVELQVNGDLPGSVDDFIPIKRESSVDPDLLEDARIAITDALRAEGYWRARVEHARSTPSPDRLVISFNIVRGKRYRIVRVEVPDGLQVSAEEFRAPKALKTGAWFDQHGVESGLVIIKGLYQQLGFHSMVMKPVYEDVDGRSPEEGGVIIRPNVTEGPQAVVSSITFDLGENPRVSETQLRAVMLSKPQAPFNVGNLVIDREQLPAVYERLGFLTRDVAIAVELNPTGTEAALKVIAREGPQILVGEIVVVGNERIERDGIIRDITLRVGEPYSEDARVESHRRLYDTTSFRTVRITVDERLPGETTVRVVIAVEEASTLTFDFGGGLEGGTHPRAVEGGGIEDRLEFAPRAFVGLGRRNLGGRNRAVSAFARVSFKPKNAPNDPAQDGRGLGFTEYRMTGSYNERYAFRTPTDIQISVMSEQAVRTSFNFIRRVATAEVFRAATPRVSVSGRYALEWTRLFDEVIPDDQQPLIDRLFPQVRLSILSGGAIWDRRDNPINPTSGGQVNANLDVAIRPLGSEVGFAKAFGQVSIFRRIPAPKTLVLAGRVQFGLARGFQRTVQVVDDNGLPVLDPNGQPAVQIIEDLPASQRFFAGGSTTVRGFQLDRLGVAEILNDNGLSNGGNGLIVLNAELRALVGRLFQRDLSVVGFVDAGNVFRRVTDLDLTRLRAAVGFGVRYDSWLGPIRLDVGFKTDRMVFPNARERRWELHLSIGEVF